jgi:hypothetical protein
LLSMPACCFCLVAVSNLRGGAGATRPPLRRPSSWLLFAGEEPRGGAGSARAGHARPACTIRARPPDARRMRQARPGRATRSRLARFALLLSLTRVRCGSFDPGGPLLDGLVRPGDVRAARAERFGRIYATGCVRVRVRVRVWVDRERVEEGWREGGM